jgi:hypothetical protein
MKLFWMIGIWASPKNFDDPEAAADRKRRSALAGEIAGLERLVRIEDSAFLAILAADVDADAVFGPRRTGCPYSPSVPVKLALRDLLRRACPG